MLHSSSLRAIGQSLEMLRVQAFGLEKEGDSYIVRSESLTATRQWILRNNLETDLDSPGPDQKSTQLTWGDGWLCYGPFDVARLDEQGRKKRQDHGFAPLSRADTLGQLLRALGEHLDRKEATAFKISWAPGSVVVDYQMSDGVSERKNFTVEKLHQLALHSRFRKPSRSASIGSR